MQVDQTYILNLRCQNGQSAPVEDSPNVRRRALQFIRRSSNPLNCNPGDIIRPVTSLPDRSAQSATPESLPQAA
jgi:hypothetical protein